MQDHAGHADLFVVLLFEDRSWFSSRACTQPTIQDVPVFS